jgi:dihydrofolate synthase/folylpolyglutamate synthase
MPDHASYARALEGLLSAPTLPKLGLQRMAALCAALGDPQDAVPILHVAGTKGKGSTSAMAASMLREAGLRVGMTTSPHLMCARERIVIDGAMISERDFADLAHRVHVAAATLPPALEEPSFFERICAMAFCAFQDAKVDVAVVEVGLGGRLDATNVVRPRATAITRLGIDHTEFLGPTLAHIAAEKAGIIKPGVVVVTAPQRPEAMQVLNDAAQRAGAEIIVVDVDAAPHSSLRGEHQRENAAVAQALVQHSGFGVDTKAIARGAAHTHWPARYETVSTSPLIIVDGAHDEVAAVALAEVIAADDRLKGRPLVLVAGMSSGHDPTDVLTPLSRVGFVHGVATAAKHPRALPADDVAAALGAVMGDATVTVDADVSGAIAHAASVAVNAAVIVAGSLFVAGEARSAFIDMAVDPARPHY